jgi:hypothetical protein
MQRANVSCVKWASMPSGNKIQEIVMESDSDEDKYYDSVTKDEEPCPPLRQYSTSQLPSPDYSASSSEDEVNVRNVTGQQPQPSQWTLNPKPQRRVVQTFTRATNGKSSEATH